MAKTNDNGLTKQQQAFVDAYLCDPELNATECVRKAGYNTKYPDRIAHQLLGNARVVEVIRKTQEERSKRTQITADMVVRELAKIGFSDMRKFTKWGSSGVVLKNSDELSDDDAACVSEVSETVTKDGGSLRFKLHDKKGALELLGRHLGMFTDKVEHSGEMVFSIKKPSDLDDSD